MQKLDYDLLAEVMAGFSRKRAFVPMPGGQVPPEMADQQQAGGQPPPGQPPGGAVAVPGQLPPEMVQMLQDPAVQQTLVQSGLMLDASGSVIDQASGQALTPEQVAQVLQQLQAPQEGQPAPEGQAPQEGQPAPEGQAPSPEQQDPMALIMQKLDELIEAVRSGKNGGQEKKQSPAEKLDTVMAELQRTNEMLASLTGQQ